jgi:hypothetical protein
MLEHFTENGIEALELDLRTSFLNKMVVNQDRTVIEQTIRRENIFFVERSSTH